MFLFVLEPSTIFALERLEDLAGIANVFAIKSLWNERYLTCNDSDWSHSVTAMPWSRGWERWTIEEYGSGVAAVDSADSSIPAAHPKESTGVCVICLTSTSTHAVLPCGHLCLCSGCATSALRLAVCPVCQTTVGTPPHVAIFRP